MFDLYSFTYIRDINEKNVVAKQTSAQFVGRTTVHSNHRATEEATLTHPAAGAAWTPTWARGKVILCLLMLQQNLAS